MSDLVEEIEFIKTMAKAGDTQHVPYARVTLFGAIAATLTCLIYVIELPKNMAPLSLFGARIEMWQLRFYLSCVPLLIFGFYVFWKSTFSAKPTKTSYIDRVLQVLTVNFVKMLIMAIFAIGFQSFVLVVFPNSHPFIVEQLEKLSRYETNSISLINFVTPMFEKGLTTGISTVFLIIIGGFWAIVAEFSAYKWLKAFSILTFAFAIFGATLLEIKTNPDISSVIIVIFTALIPSLMLYFRFSPIEKVGSN